MSNLIASKGTTPCAFSCGSSPPHSKYPTVRPISAAAPLVNAVLSRGDRAITWVEVVVAVLSRSTYGSWKDCGSVMGGG